MSLRINIPADIKVVSGEGNRAEVMLEGLYPGYGVTIGNALRRVLLSSLPGAAITSFRIAGVQHEFTTIPGVEEDIVDTSLNLKLVRFRMFVQDPVELVLKAKGEREVIAADIAKHSDVEVINPNAHIATLTAKNAELDMVLRVNRGIGYSPVELRKKEKLPIGEIAVDAIFTPIQKVNFEVENMRVGDRTDYNRLRITVETDGSIGPLTAVKEASRILTEHFAVFEKLESPRGAPGAEKAEESVKKRGRSPHAQKKPLKSRK